MRNELVLRVRRGKKLSVIRFEVNGQFRIQFPSEIVTRPVHRLMVGDYLCIRLA